MHLLTINNSIMELEQRQYPIGKWTFKKKYSEKEIQRFIAIIEKYPAKYKRLTKHLSDSDLAKTYREGGWNTRQVITHIADMHILHFARFKQALCDDNPVGFAANINGWNSLAEVNNAPVASDDAGQTLKNIPVSGKVTNNDIDPDGDVLSASVISSLKPEEIHRIFLMRAYSTTVPIWVSWRIFMHRH